MSKTVLYSKVFISIVPLMFSFFLVLLALEKDYLKASKDMSRKAKLLMISGIVWKCFTLLHYVNESYTKDKKIFIFTASLQGIPLSIFLILQLKFQMLILEAFFPSTRKVIKARLKCVFVFGCFCMFLMLFGSIDGCVFLSGSRLLSDWIGQLLWLPFPLMMVVYEIVHAFIVISKLHNLSKKKSKNTKANLWTK
jgi:hypothetical protein